MEQEKNKSKFIKKLLSPKLLIIFIVIAALAVGAIGLNKALTAEKETIQLNLKDIGELATQSAYCKEVSSVEASRELFGVKVPLTQSKYIYSYGVEIKAGYDFGEIDWKEKDTTIEVRLPKVKTLSKALDLDSLKVYYEDESIFRNISLEERNKDLIELENNAEKDAIANGLYKEARANAETILTTFFGQVYDLKEYKIVFKDKK